MKMLIYAIIKYVIPLKNYLNRKGCSATLTILCYTVVSENLLQKYSNTGRQALVITALLVNQRQLGVLRLLHVQPRFKIIVYFYLACFKCMLETDVTLYNNCGEFTEM